MIFPFLKQKQTILISVLLIMIVFSCSPPASKMAKYGPVFENVMLTETGVFRGLSLGASFDSVQLKEQVKPIETDSGYLYYEMKLDTTGSFNIIYNFDDNELNEIQSDILINNAANTEEVFAKFKMYFDEHYGESQNHQGFTVWTVKSDKLGLVRINLSVESSNFASENAPGKISLWIYPDKD